MIDSVTFTPGEEPIGTHQKTDGTTLTQQIYKATLYVFATLRNLWSQPPTNPEKSIAYKAVHPGILYSQGEVVRFGSDLKNITFSGEGLVSGTTPAQGITRKPDNVLLYPYVVEKKGVFSVNHIVLIAVDPDKKKIYYFDSQGLSSDDPKRSINLRGELETIGRNLFPNDTYSIEESRLGLQSDPYNCGAFVMMAMEKFNEGKDLEDVVNALREEKGIRQAAAKAFSEHESVEAPTRESEARVESFDEKDIFDDMSSP
ncbi:MAG: hypothetical protein KDK65_04440 [Chlamydiia bacterium]|nr:hypothetical protein [Chlamydiia bacterium]